MLISLDINEPIFYHLKIEENDKKERIFYKDLSIEEVKGLENIKRKNMELNKELSSPYLNENCKEIFYMTEIRDISNIEDKEYFKTHDIVDIPWLSEYNNQNEENDNNSINNNQNNNNSFSIFNQEEEICEEKEIKNKQNEDIDDKEKYSYLFTIFDIIKNKMDGGIIILSVENYYERENYEIIKKIHSVIKQPIKNCLIILNKMDLSVDYENDISKCRGKFLEYFADKNILNLKDNIFIPISLLQMENELKAKKDFHFLLNYHFINYLIDLNNEKKKINFIEYLKEVIVKKNKINKKTINIELNKLKGEELKKFKNITKLIIEDINEKYKGGKINLGIIIDDFNEEEEENELDEEENEEDEYEYELNISSINVIKLIYIYFLDHKFLPKLYYNTLLFLNYFKNHKENKQIKKEDINEIINYNNEEIKYLNIFANELNNFTVKDEYLNKIKSIIDSGINNIYNRDYIYVPIVGNSNVGKTTILNCIVGNNLFPVKFMECTKKGIIVRYWDKDNVKLNKVFLKQKECCGNKYYYFESGNNISNNIYEINTYLNDLNWDYNNEENKFFYEIYIKIKLLDDLGLDPELKRKICFIDFPGFGTDINFEVENIYKKVMSICNSFMFVVRNSTIKEEKNIQNLNNIFSLIKNGNSLVNSTLIKYCLFVINCDIDQTSEKDDINLLKEQIKSILKLKDTTNINICFFNAFYYLEYTKIYNYFINFKKIFIEEAYNYQNEKNNIINQCTSYLYKKISNFKILFKENDEINNEKPKKDFSFYINKKLEEKFKKVFKIKIPKSYKIHKDIENKIEDVIKIINNSVFDINILNEKYSKNIKIILSYGFDNIKRLTVYQKSFINNFIESIKKQINFSEENVNNIKKDILEKVLDNLDFYFLKDFEENNMDDSSKNKFISYIETQKNLIINYSVEKCKNGPSEVLRNYLKDTIKRICNKKNNWNEKNLDIDKFENNLKFIVSYDLNRLKFDFINEIDNVSNGFSNFLEEIQKEINLFNKNDSVKLKKLNNLKKYISESISLNEEEFGTEIFNDIINSSFGLSQIWKKSFFQAIKSFFSSEVKLNNEIALLSENILNIIENNCYNLNYKIKDYKDKLLVYIDNASHASLINFSGEKQKEWKKLCLKYLDLKTLLLQIILKIYSKKFINWNN